MIILKTEYAHSLKPEFIKKVVERGHVITGRGYVYIYKSNLGIVIRKDLTGQTVKICNIEVA